MTHAIRNARFTPRGAGVAVACALLHALSGRADARNIEWSGYTWWVRTSNGNPQGPGPNIFSDSAQSVFVDDEGNLHLKIRQGTDGKWLASEIDMNQSLGYGTYEWEVSSRYDQFATNAVTGLFTYLSPQSVASQTGGVVGNGVADTPHEIDVEFTRAWGSGNLYFTTHDGDVPAPSKNYYQALTGPDTTHRFTWAPGRIAWESFHGHVAGVADPTSPIVEQRPGMGNGLPARHVYTGPVVPRDLNEIPIINFWISSPNPSVNGPTGGVEQELVVRSFRYTPLAESADFDGDGVVDGRDLLTWQRGLGGAATHPAGDANYDGAVDAHDLAVWAAQYGDRPGRANPAPEPSALSLAAVVLVWLVRVAMF
jgi:hypothetical protein